MIKLLFEDNVERAKKRLKNYYYALKSWFNDI